MHYLLEYEFLHLNTTDHINTCGEENRLYKINKYFNPSIKFDITKSS